MKNKKLIVLIFIIIAVSFLVFFQKNRWYSAADVAKHSGETSCWTTINGSVYDVTKLTDTHSGGPKTILQVCGKDGSAIFNQRHGEEEVPKLEMEKYKIGTIHL